MRLSTKIKILGFHIFALCSVLACVVFYVLGQEEKIEKLEHVNERQEIMINKFNRFYQEHENRQQANLGS